MLIPLSHTSQGQRTLFHCFQGERKGEGNINVREKHQLFASHMRPERESNLQPRYVPRLNQTDKLSVTGRHCNQATLARAKVLLFYIESFIHFLSAFPSLDEYFPI